MKQGKAIVEWIFYVAHIAGAEQNMKWWYKLCLVNNLTPGICSPWGSLKYLLSSAPALPPPLVAPSLSDVLTTTLCSGHGIRQKQNQQGKVPLHLPLAKLWALFQQPLIFCSSFFCSSLHLQTGDLWDSIQRLHTCFAAWATALSHLQRHFLFSFLFLVISIQVSLVAQMVICP